MTQLSPKLKKRPDQSKLLAEARRAVKPDMAKPAAPAPEAPRKRGRPAGVRFPSGYKKSAKAQASPAPAAEKPAAGEERPQAAPADGKATDEAIFKGLGGEGERVDPETKVHVAGFEIDVRDSVELLTDVIFNQVLAESRGEHWRLTEAKVKALAAPLTDILDELLPGLANNKWTYRIGAIAAVMGPCLFMDAMMHPESYAWLNLFKKKPHAPKPEPSQPDKKQPDAGARPQGTGENLSLEARPQAA